MFLLFLSRKLLTVFSLALLLLFNLAYKNPSESSARSAFELVVYFRSRSLIISAIETFSELGSNFCDNLNCSAVGTPLLILAVDRPLSVLLSISL